MKTYIYKKIVRLYYILQNLEKLPISNLTLPVKCVAVL